MYPLNLDIDIKDKDNDNTSMADNSKNGSTDYISTLLEMIQEKDKRINELTDKIMELAGLIHPPIMNAGQALPPNEQVKMTPRRWDAAKRVLERRHAKTREEIEQANKSVESQLKKVEEDLEKEA